MHFWVHLLQVGSKTKQSLRLGFLPAKWAQRVPVDLERQAANTIPLRLQTCTPC